ncbi:MAG TPA: hypothetical protein VMU46_01850 [Burkholderiales bacterium]|nr:hypothetical protein [Burkholderiales bacterium]
MRRGRTAFALAGAALLAAGIYAAVLEGLADAHYYNARTILASVRDKRPLEANELASAQASLAEAHALEPANPLFVEQGARVKEMEALRLPRGDPAASALLREALDGFHGAALMRPGSPYAWASIALLKLRLAEIDPEFYDALERAARLGPWEPPVQIAIADAGLASWPGLAPPAKTVVIAALERGLQREEPEIRRLAAAHGTLPLVCATPALPPRLAALCVKI